VGLLYFLLYNVPFLWYTWGRLVNAAQRGKEAGMELAKEVFLDGEEAEVLLWWERIVALVGEEAKVYTWNEDAREPVNGEVPEDDDLWENPEDKKAVPTELVDVALWCMRTYGDDPRLAWGHGGVEGLAQWLPSPCWYVAALGSVDLFIHKG
jgi:hypothetical protein